MMPRVRIFFYRSGDSAALTQRVDRAQMIFVAAAGKGVLGAYPEGGAEQRPLDVVNRKGVAGEQTDRHTPARSDARRCSPAPVRTTAGPPTTAILPSAVAGAP